jgi:aspartyl-tRNA(Asn)/glutamyl-tRNA(Gln) amidotransferase subunit A
MQFEQRGETIMEASARIAAGLSPVTLAEECLERIARGNGDLRALIFVDEGRVLDDALRAQREIRSGNLLGPLQGIPVAIKDNFDVAGWPTSLGSRLLGDAPASRTASCIANLRKTGAVVIGKANLHELCAGGAANPWFGQVVNPLDPARGTGGTSSGSAAAVAAGFCLAAIGSDSGGSNRSPAAATGLFGFKPTNGLIDTQGLHSMAPSFDCVGTIARSVWDTRLVTEALSGRRLERGAPVEQARIAICPDLTRAPVDATVARAIEGWLDRSGIDVVEIPFDGHEDFVAAGLAILMHEFAATYGDAILARPSLVGDAVRAFLDTSMGVGEATYQRALRLRHTYRDRLAGMMAGVDALAVPTGPGRAPRLSDEQTFVNGQWVPWGPAGGAFRRWANMLGMPALAMPAKVPGDLPASVQLAMLPGRDAELLALAELLERDPEPVRA